MIADSRRYASYRYSGLPWLGSIPEHWQLRRMKFLFREVDARSEYGREQLLRVSQYTGVTPRTRDSGTPDTRAPSLVGYKKVAPDDLVINIMLAWNGSMGVSRHEGVVSPAYCVYRFRHEAQPWFFHALLRSPPYRARIKTASTGVVESRLRLYSENLGRIEVLLPPPEEQAAIVRFLDHVGGRIERAIRAKRKVIALLQEHKQVIIHRAVTLGVGDHTELRESTVPWIWRVPGTWEVLRLGNVVRLLTGYPFPSARFTHAGTGIRLLRGINVSPGRLRWEDVVRWERVAGDGLDDFVLRVGDVVLGMDRPIIGSGVRVAAIQKSDVPSLLVQRVARLRPTARLDADYLLILLHSRMFADYMEPIFTGISVPHLSPEQIKGFCLPLPPLDEQRAIVALTMVQTEGIDATAAKLCDEISLLQEYRTRLTTDVVTGKLDVREAASKLPDEPIDHDSPSELVDDLVDEEVAVE